MTVSWLAHLCLPVASINASRPDPAGQHSRDCDPKKNRSRRQKDKRGRQTCRSTTQLCPLAHGQAGTTQNSEFGPKAQGRERQGDGPESNCDIAFCPCRSHNDSRRLDRVSQSDSQHGQQRNEQTSQKGRGHSQGKEPEVQSRLSSQDCAPLDHVSHPRRRNTRPNHGPRIRQFFPST